MNRTIVVDGVKWSVSTSGWSHEVDKSWSTGLRFVDGSGAEVFGRWRIEPEKIDSVSDDDLATALRSALDPTNEE